MAEPNGKSRNWARSGSAPTNCGTISSNRYWIDWTRPSPCRGESASIRARPSMASSIRCAPGVSGTFSRNASATTARCIGRCHAGSPRGVRGNLVGIDRPLRPARCGHLAVAGGRRGARQSALGGDQIGNNPTDRAKNGTKRSLIVDGEGGPLGVVVAGANVHDAKLLEATIEAMVSDRPEPEDEEQHLCLDKG